MRQFTLVLPSAGRAEKLKGGSGRTFVDDKGRRGPISVRALNDGSLTASGPAVSAQLTGLRSLSGLWAYRHGDVTC